jgi:cation diffusion facilitator family transporter
MGGVSSLTARGDNRVAVQRVLLVALAVNVSVSLLKLVIGLLTGSLAVLADAMHSATDGLSSLMGLITNNLSDPNPDRDHPYGHDKYEALGALAIAGFILVTALEILRTAIERIASGLRPLRLDAHDLVLLLIVLGCNLLLAAYERSEGRRQAQQHHHGGAAGPGGGRAARPELARRGPGHPPLPVAGPRLLAGAAHQPALAGGPNRHRPGGHP